MSSRKRRRARQLRLGLRAREQYIRALQGASLGVSFPSLMVANKVRRAVLLRRYAVVELRDMYRAYLLSVKVDPFMIFAVGARKFGRLV